MQFGGERGHPLFSGGQLIDFQLPAGCQEAGRLEVGGQVDRVRRPGVLDLPLRSVSNHYALEDRARHGGVDQRPCRKELGGRDQMRARHAEEKPSVAGVAPIYRLFEVGRHFKSAQ